MKFVDKMTSCQFGSWKQVLVAERTGKISAVAAQLVAVICKTEIN